MRDGVQAAIIPSKKACIVLIVDAPRLGAGSYVLCSCRMIGQPSASNSDLPHIGSRAVKKIRKIPELLGKTEGAEV